MATINIELSKCYDQLLNQAKSLRMLVKTQEQQISYLNKRISEFDERKLQASEAQIESQREVIEKLTNELDQKWISVEERLPEVQTLYLCLGEDGWQWVDRLPDDAIVEGCKVTHWMPLPSPPGEE